MKIRKRSLLGGAGALSLATALLVGGMGVAAYADSPPAWEPDAGALGSITFYDAAGDVITGGDITTPGVVAYAAASGPGRAGDSKAQLRAYSPQFGVNPASWSGDTIDAAATTYPVTSGPSNIRALTNPVVTLGPGDFSLADYFSEYPNLLTQTGYQNLYELRLYTSGIGQAAGFDYYRVDILVNATAVDGSGIPTAGTWSVAYPAAATATGTTLTASPSGSAEVGDPVVLTAHVTPTGVAGSVEFYDNSGTTDLGAGSYDSSTGLATLTVTPALGSHSFSATFTPTDTGAYTGSTGTLSYTITEPLTPTTTSLSESPASPASLSGSDTTVDVDLTAQVGPTGLAGSVEFFDGTNDLGGGTYDSGTGVATKTVALDADTHLLTATFTPNDTSYAPSTSEIDSYIVLPANYGSAGIDINAQDNTEPFAGSLTLNVSVSSVSLTQTADHPVRADDPTGHRHAWVFTGNLSGVSVTDTRQTQPGWTVTGQTSNFTNGATTVPAADLGWTPGSPTGDAEGTVTAGVAVSNGLQASGAAGLSAVSDLAQAAAGNGLTGFAPDAEALSAALALWIPDSSPTGLYHSVLTLTLISP